MPLQVEDVQPWTPNLFPKQQLLFNTGTADDAGVIHPNSPTAILVSGPRYSSKSFGADHRMIRHLFETPGGRFAIINKTLRNTTDSGTQQRLTEFVIPEWIEANIGFEYTTKDGDGIPGFKTDGRTRTPFCRFTNAHGGESEIRILSVEHDCEIETKLKDSFWSGIRLIELANFKDPKIFTVSWEQLRMPHLKPWQHLWLADTNPAVEGEDSWIYKFWFLRDWSAVTLTGADNNKERGDEIKRCRDKFEKSLRLIEIFLEDNLGLTPDQIEDRKALHSGDPGEYARDVEGKWVAGSGGANRHFADVFSRATHVIEEDIAKGIRIELSPNTNEILGSWDVGSVNHGIVALEKRFVTIQDREWPVWVCLRELESVGDKIKLEDLAVTALDIFESIPSIYERKLDFRHWSDSSSIDTFRPTGAGYDYLEIMAATDNKIILQGVHKPDGSVETRIRLLRRLLREKRIYVSSLCPRVIYMLENIARGNTLKDRLTPSLKHIFDALTYAIFMESAADLAEIAFKPSTTGGSKLISVSFAR